MNDKQPPIREREERLILGSIILMPDKLYEIIDFLKPENFYNECNQIIFSTIISMFNKNKKIDLITITNELRKSGNLDKVGGSVYLTELANNIGSGENIDIYSFIMLESYLSRKMIEISYDTFEKAHDETNDIFEIINDTQSKIETLLSEIKTGKKDIKVICSEIIERIEENQHGDYECEISTGDAAFDRFSYGLHKTDFVILAGESSNGKTSKALDMCLSIAKSGKPVGFYSIEMTSTRITARLIAKLSGVDSKRIMNAKLEEHEIISVNEAIRELEKLPLIFDECPSANYKDIINSIRSDKMKFGIEIAFIDYLQLLTSSTRNKTREQEVGDFAKAFKKCAKQIDICIVALSQLSRDRDKPKPTISRLRDSGQVEEAADVVMMIWIPQRYGKDSIILMNGREISAKNRAHIIIAKGRDIGTTDYVQEMDFRTQTFSEYIDESLDYLKIKKERSDWVNEHENKDLW